MAAIEKLSRKRSAVKGKLTSFKSYLDINKTCRQLSDIQLEELDLRLSKIVASLDEFDDFQGQIEELVDDSEAEEQFKHRSDFEAEYYSVIAEARVLANKHRLSLKDDESEINNARVTSLQRFQRIELLKQHFWNRFSNEYILWLQNRTKWRASKGTLEEGTMVIVKDQTIPPLMWLLGRVVRVFPGNDGIVRVADIKTRKGIIRRAFNNICPLPIKSVED